MAGRKLVKSVRTLIIIGYCSFMVQQREVTCGFLKAGLNLPLSRFNKNYVTLDDIFIGVKTTRHYEQTRLPLIMQTWYQLAKKQIWFFTDKDDPLNQKLTNGHMVNTKCKASYEYKNLCCKTGVEYDYFLKTNKKWFCHFDDDNYVNVPHLLTVLNRYNYDDYWYLGQTSMDTPTTIEKHNSLFTFRFGTGGAGICITRNLAVKMSPFVIGGRLMAVCEYLGSGDDVTLGFIIATNSKPRTSLMCQGSQRTMTVLGSCRCTVFFSHTLICVGHSKIGTPEVSW
ncbi:fringe glycosyltransferase-like isoform X2 [Choristoneura fumiferana]|uniref:fringe glycosyltransferase-like isoform X2 n=1 Tax=Choristoneura fumiferana TaxID=7141 RepID=UPI003D15A6B0